MKNVKALFIDCDGVLYDKDKLSYHDMAVVAFGKTLETFGVSREEVDKKHINLRKKGVRGLLNVALDVCKTRHVSFRDFATTMAQNTNYSRIPTDKDMLNLLEKVGKKIPVYIVTNNTWIHLFHIIKCLNGGIPKQFIDLNVLPITIEDTLYDGVFHPKKVDGQFLSLCAQTGKMPCDVLVLDDAEDVCVAAKAQGLQVQQVQNPDQTKTVLRSIIHAGTKTKRAVSVRQARGGSGR